jgi:hypothetical protein
MISLLQSFWHASIDAHLIIAGHGTRHRSGISSTDD